MTKEKASEILDKAEHDIFMDTEKFRMVAVVKNKDQLTKELSKAVVIPLDNETETILKDLWNKRNPRHDLNADTEKDMFWGTAICVINDLIKTLHKAV